PDAETDPLRHLVELYHVVREEDQHGAIRRIRLPPAAIRTRPADRAGTAATAERIGRLRVHHGPDAHAVAMTPGKERPPEHARRRALLRRQLVRGHDCQGLSAKKLCAVRPSANEHSRE